MPQTGYSPSRNGEEVFRKIPGSCGRSRRCGEISGLARFITAVLVVAALGLMPAGCGSAPAGKPLGPGLVPTSPALGLGHSMDAATGVLTYAVAFAGQTMVSVELAEHFDLVVRNVAGRSATEIHRIALGSAAYDIEDLAVDAARARAFVASRDGRVRGVDLKTGAFLFTWHLGSSATAVAVSPDGRHLVMGTADGLLCLRRLRDGALLQCVTAHPDHVSSLAISPSGQILASSSFAGEVILWRLPSLAIVRRRRFAGAACDLAFAPGGRSLAIARSAEPPERSPAVVARERKHGAFTPHPWHAVSIWTLAGTKATNPAGAGERVVHLTGHGGPVTAVAFTPDGARLVSGSWDRSIRLWDVASRTELARYTGFALLVRDVAVDPTGRRVAAAAWTRALSGRSTVIFDLLYPQTGD